MVIGIVVVVGATGPLVILDGGGHVITLLLFNALTGPNIGAPAQPVLYPKTVK